MKIGIIAIVCLLIFLYIIVSGSNSSEAPRPKIPEIESSIEEKKGVPEKSIEIHENYPVAKYDKKESILKFLESIKHFPAEIFSKFMKDNLGEQFKKSYSNKIYGSSVLNPITTEKTYNDHPLVKKIGNYLEDDVKALTNSDIKCRYFSLKNLYIYEKRDHAFFVDLSILIQKDLSDEDVILLNNIQEMFSGNYDSNR